MKPNDTLGCFVVIMIWLFWFLVSLSIAAAVLYVAWHFISKFW